jgi:Mrp family chromosome partitioning ATPase
VLLVDADPERRELADVGDSAPARPLEDLGRPGVSRDQVLVPVPTSGGAELLVAKVGADKSAMLDGAAVGRVLAELGQSFDLVLLQSGPVPKSPVAFALVEQAAAVVLVARTRDSARSVVELRDRLDAARRPLVGLVLTGRRRGPSWVSSQPAAAPEEPDRAASAPAPVQPARPSSPAEPAADRDEELGAPTR